MSDKVLYFPYIRVPQTHWFTRCLLYWDQVRTIVPFEMHDRPDMLGAYTRDLIAAKLVVPIFPDRYLGAVPHFTDSFLNQIDHDSEVSIRGREPLIDEATRSAIRSRRPGIDPGQPLVRELLGPPPPGTSFVHVGKTGWPLAHALEERNLATFIGGPKYEFWCVVEKRTAELFMAYLAIVLGQLDQLRMTPITDQFASLSVFSATPQRISQTIVLADRLQLEIIDRILPAPNESVSVEQLARFKFDHGDLLGTFRNKIEGFVLGVAQETDETVKNRRLELFRRELQRDIDEVRARMHERRWPKIVFGAVCGVAAAAAPVITAATAGAAAPTLVAIPGLLSAAYMAFDDVRRPRDFLKGPVAYAALTQERFGA